LLRMADVLDRRSEIPDIETELEFLTRFVNENMWNEKIGFYVDQYRDGTLSEVKSIGAFWALLADMVPQDRLKSFCAHLDDSDEFNRPHRIPSLSADTPGYSDEGSYWRGGVWAITNLMVLRGLTNYGLDSLSHAIALNHILNVVERFKETGTIWENYAPEPNVIPSNSRPNFVGFSGVSPITIFFEYVLGIRPDGPGNKIIWDIRLCEKHGILQYPFGEKGLVKLTCEKRNDPSEEPVITVSSNIPFTLLVKWNGGIKTIPVQADN
jgi:glycogen debranching enzyme